MKSEMCKMIFLMAFFIQSPVLMAQDAVLGQVLSVRGNASIDGRKLLVGDSIFHNGLFSTEENSVLRIFLVSPKSLVTMGPSSKMRLEAAEKSSSRVIHLEGLARMIFKKTDKKRGEEAYPFYTQNASFGIRGTDIMVIRNSMLQETELIVFEGKVNFKSRLSPEEKVVPAGYWGGLGGRFTDRIGKLIKLPENVVKIFKERGHVEVDFKDVHEDSDFYGEKVPNNL